MRLDSERSSTEAKQAREVSTDASTQTLSSNECVFQDFIVQLTYTVSKHSLFYDPCLSVPPSSSSTRYPHDERYT